ncbi:7 transmembrane receptor (rhodopsin family) domain-containing protein [Ditylenchus destructor]|nr:7 transmembrane receptor (rhodopsin family) domain-containing protein [Ditylenchus destructor]
MDDSIADLLNYLDNGGSFPTLNNTDVLLESTALIPTTSAVQMVNDTSAMNVTESGMPAYCIFEQPPLTDVRFWIVTVFGTCVSLVSIVQNAFFFYLFSTRKHHRTTYNMYMMFLAMADIFVSAAYVLLMSMNVLSDYLVSPMLVRIWFSYMVPILTVSHCGITSSCFLILAATFERYCLTMNSKYIRFVQKNRKFIVLFAIFFGVLSKGTICFEFKITYLEECAGEITEIRLEFADFVYDTPYNTVWRFWYRNFVTVFFPFFALLFLNIRIVRALSRNEKFGGCYTTNSKQFKRKKVARSATRTTVLVVFTYLISNIINVVLTTWEHIDKMSLLTEYVRMYAIALDLASLMTNMACAFRPIIYLICQPTLRQEVFKLIKKMCSPTTKKFDGNNNHSTMVTDIMYTQDSTNYPSESTVLPSSNCVDPGANHSVSWASPLLPANHQSPPSPIVHMDSNVSDELDLADCLADEQEEESTSSKFANGRLVSVLMPNCAIAPSASALGFGSGAPRNRSVEPASLTLRPTESNGLDAQKRSCSVEPTRSPVTTNSPKTPSSSFRNAQREMFKKLFFTTENKETLL